MKRELRIPAGDIELAATLHEDMTCTQGDTVMLFNSAMGTARDFYTPFAAYFSSQGIPVLLWDYRGIGDSKCHSPVHIHDWGERDLPAMIDWMRSHYPNKRLVIVAHSVGGQVLGMTPKVALADRLVVIGSQSGYWRLWSGKQQLRIGFIWHVVIPLVTRLFGYFPARWFGVGENLPAGVARQWAQWGRDPDYLMGKHRRESTRHFAEIESPLLNVWISDDEIASHAANRRMTTWYANARIEHLDLHPADFNVDRIGHYRLFRETVGPRFWPTLHRWIVRHET